MCLHGDVYACVHLAKMHVDVRVMHESACVCPFPFTSGPECIHTYFHTHYIARKLVHLILATFFLSNCCRMHKNSLAMARLFLCMHGDKATLTVTHKHASTQHTKPCMCKTTAAYEKDHLHATTHHTAGKFMHDLEAHMHHTAAYSSILTVEWSQSVPRWGKLQ